MANPIVNPLRMTGPVNAPEGLNLGTTLFELACRLADVPDGEPGTHPRADRSDDPRPDSKNTGSTCEVLEALPKEERVRVIEAHMPDNIPGLAELLANEWCHRIVDYVTVLVNAGMCSEDSILGTLDGITGQDRENAGARR